MAARSATNTLAAVAVGAGVLALAALGAGSRGQRFVVDQQTVLTPSGTPLPEGGSAAGSPTAMASLVPGVDTTPERIPPWLLALAGIVAAAIIGFVVIMIVRALGKLRLRRYRSARDVAPASDVGSFDDAELGDELRRNAEQALARLNAGSVSADATIIECWRRFADAAARRGIERQSAQTSSDFVATVLARTGADPAPTQHLGELYRRTQFDDWTPGERDVDEARACLERIIASLPGGDHAA